MTRRPALPAIALALSLAAPATASAKGEVYLWSGAEPSGTIVIDTSERRLYLVVGEGEALSYRVAVGKPGAQWFGETHVVRKAEHPTWRPTPSMRAGNPRLPGQVGPGPSNPLGVRAIYLAQGLLRIHGTNAPSSIGRAASSGCFRMRNEDVAELYEMVEAGAPVTVR